MRSLRRNFYRILFEINTILYYLYFNEYAARWCIEDPGCGSHAVNKVQERYYKLEEHKSTMEKMEELQTQLKNDEIRHYIQANYRSADAELRVGITAPGLFYINIIIYSANIYNIIKYIITFKQDSSRGGVAMNR